MIADPVIDRPWVHSPEDLGTTPISANRLYQSLMLSNVGGDGSCPSVSGQAIGVAGPSIGSPGRVPLRATARSEPVAERVQPSRK